LPRFDSVVFPLYVPDCLVVRSKSQNLRNYLTWLNLLIPPASASIVSAMIGPIPGTVFKRK